MRLLRFDPFPESAKTGKRVNQALHGLSPIIYSSADGLQISGNYICKNTTKYNTEN